ncbi:MAG: hypothetical protein R2795_03055 [Saprospiraceae bacterium]
MMLNVWNWCKQHKAAAFLLSLEAIALVGLLVWLVSSNAIGGNQAPTERQRVEQSAHKKR